MTPAAAASTIRGMSTLPKLSVLECGPRRHVSSGAPWEAAVGYSRAVRTGAFIAVTGTVGIRPDGSYAESAADQTRQALAIIAEALRLLDAACRDVIRTRVYVTDISEWASIGAVHAEVFGHIRPATTMVQVAKLIDPRAKVEIEADAVVDSAVA